MPGIVIIGAGQGGCQVAMSLRQGGYAGSVMLLGDEPDLPYQRPPLSKGFLTGAVGADDLLLRPPSYFASQAIDLRCGVSAAAIEPAARLVRLSSGETLEYAHLVLATGARHRRLGLPGAALEGVLAVRTLAEARALRPRLAAARRLVVIGAGFIGLEIAAIAAANGTQVEVVEATQQPLGRALSAAMARSLTEAHRAAGVRFHLGAVVQAILGDTQATAVQTATEVLPADLVVVGIGILPNAELAEAAGLAIAGGIVVDEHLLTADPAISAIGDCASYPSRFAAGLVRLESVQNAVDQARCVAARLLGKPAPYQAVPWFWSDQGKLALQIAGLTAGHEMTVFRGHSAELAFSVFCFGQGRLLGVESLNRPADHMAARRLLARDRPLSPEQAEDLAFDLKGYAAA